MGGGEGRGVGGGWRIVPLTAVIRMPSGIVGKEGGTQDAGDTQHRFSFKPPHDQRCFAKKEFRAEKRNLTFCFFFCKPASDVL